MYLAKFNKAAYKLASLLYMHCNIQWHAPIFTKKEVDRMPTLDMFQSKDIIEIIILYTGSEEARYISQLNYALTAARIVS